MDKISAALDFLLKIPTALLISITCLLGIMIFIPNSLASQLALDEFLVNYRKFIGPTFLLFVFFLLSRIVNKVYSNILIFIENRKLESTLDELTSEEVKYLSEFILSGENSIHKSISDGVVCGLQAKNIVFRPSMVAAHGYTFAYNLQPWARKYLNKRKDIIFSDYIK